MTLPDFEQAGELKIGQVGIANLRVRVLDIERLAREMHERVARAPQLFERAAVVVDFGGLTRSPDPETAGQLLQALRDSGVLPVALAYGTRETEALARQLGLPLLARFRAGHGGPEPAPAAPAPAVVEAPPAVVDATSTIQVNPVRSGQQLYARGRDLVVTASVGAGAEVIADGSIHVYAALRGRALAGAQGNQEARIFCREFNAELVSIAGHYKVMEDVPEALRGRPVQIWLQDEALHFEELA